MEHLGKLIAALKGSLSLALAVAVASGIVLFSPSSVIERLRLGTVIAGYSGWIGVAFVASAVLSVVLIGERTVRFVNSAVARRRTHNEALRRLRSLSTPERHVLASYLLQDTSSIVFDADNGIIGGLVAKGILYRSSFLPLRNSPFNLKIWAREHLQENPELVLEPEQMALLLPGNSGDVDEA